MLPAFFSSLQVRFLVLLLLAVLPGLGLTCYLGFEQRQRAVADARDDAVHLVHLAAANHEQLIETERQWLATVAQLPEVLAGDPSACQRRFAELRQQYPRYANLTAHEIRWPQDRPRAAGSAWTFPAPRRPWTRWRTTARRNQELGRT